ncbi:aminoglycoside phosphotransferase family protein [Deinococcus sp. Arct2-2]|uniref:aminoglycoside phosphotransferase family protein n=1 Tax=Deinococcus sp. Arct2-2 TaxID=2568653 RepID=UPI0010A57B20|nr:aminoglycoside phosphotransferase family protein [Deinococcus sp. Arct2-2]THF71348.1 aminoglycoside phosphotransferase family protein [Deinococcus sp. Arct2-2]
MSVPKLHANEFDISGVLVERLLVGQFPQWAALPLRRVLSPGTVHALYRLGNDMVVRLPRIGVDEAEVDKEHEWLPRLAPLLPVPIPAPLGRGEPTADYPSSWSIYSWLDGENPLPGQLPDARAFAAQLATFIAALQSLDTHGAPPSQRGRRTLTDLDAAAREGLAQSHGLINVQAAAQAWQRALLAPVWNGQAVWVHADLLPGNLLIQDGRLSAVIDMGSLGAGDPASDFNVAWSILPPEARQVFRHALNVDEGTWQRARGLALVIALSALPYYLHTNPAFAEIARNTIQAVLEDEEV